MLLLLAGSGRAFTLEPMSATLEPKGFGAAKTFRLDNESSNKIAFQITMATREMDEEGKENLEPVTNLFTLFPPQGIIDPGQSQNVRLVWRGTSSPTNELCYRIIAEELPVNFSLEKGKAQIKILIRYQGTVYIRPRGAKPDLKVQSLSQTPTNVWLLTIANAGSAHENLMNPRLTLTDSSGQQTVITTNYIGNIEGENVLPHHTRTFVVTLPKEIKAQDYRVKLDVDE